MQEDKLVKRGYVKEVNNYRKGFVCVRLQKGGKCLVWHNIEGRVKQEIFLSDIDITLDNFERI